MTTRLFPLLAAALLAAALLAAACSALFGAPPLPAAPGAVAVVVARTADALALEAALARAGLVEPALAPLGAALVADAPLVASVLPNGTVVVATRVGKGASSLAGAPGGGARQGMQSAFGRRDPGAGAEASPMAAARPVVGETVSVDVAGQRVLVRVDASRGGGRALAALDVPAGEEATTAALLEVLAADRDLPTPALPPAGTLRAQITRSPIGPLDVDVRLAGADVQVSARAAAAPEGVQAALAAPAPPWSCALDEGAAAVIAIPPLEGALGDVAGGGGGEPFEGRLLVAVYPPAPGTPEAAEGLASVLLAGVPRGPGARDELLASLREGGAQLSERTEGTRRFVDVSARRRLRAVLDERLFVLAVGEAAPVARVAAATGAPCPQGARPLVRVDGEALQRLLLPMLVTPEVVLRALAATANGASGVDAVPLARLRGIERLQVDARVVPGSGEVVIDGAVTLGAVDGPRGGP